MSQIKNVSGSLPSKKVVFPDLFLSTRTPALGYSHYQTIASRPLPDVEKVELRQKAEAERWTQAYLREEVNRRVDAGNDRPDFHLKVGNVWKFSTRNIQTDFDGGVHQDVVANLLHYFSDPGDTVLDPMAGGRTTRRVLGHYRYFRESVPSLEFSGPRSLVEMDLQPTHPDVRQHDAREPFPLEANSIDFALLDPPYYRIADGKYANWSENINQWRGFIRAVLGNLLVVLRADGKVAVVVDDYLRVKESISLHVAIGVEAEKVGWVPRYTITNSTPNFVVTMDGAQMARMKKARQMANHAQYIIVLEKSEESAS